MKPTEQVLQWVRDMEQTFLKLHGSEFNYRMNVKKQLIQTLQVECTNVPKAVINLFAKTRIYMRCKFLNKKRVEEALLQKHKKNEQANKRGAHALEDLSRSKAKKMKKIIV